MTGAALDEFSPPEAWDRIVQTDPKAAVVAARRVLAIPDSDVRQRAIAQGAMSRACFELGHVGQAVEASREALRAAESTGDASIRSALTMSGAAILAEAGLVDEALGALDGIRGEVAGALLGRWYTQRSYVLHHAGRLGEALEAADEGERLLRDDDDEIGLLRLLLHRGVVLLQQGRLEAAMPEFATAEAMAGRLGQGLTRALAVANGALTLGRARRIPEALAEFQRAATMYADAGQPDRTTAILEIDRAEVLMHAGMAADAVAALGRAIAYIAPGGNRVQLADARLQLARAQLMAGDVRGALLTAEAAAEDFRSSGRHAMEPHALAVSVLALLARETAGPDDLERADRIASALDESGWGLQARELRLARIRTARAIDRYDAVRGDVERFVAGRSAAQRDIALAGWYAQAVRCEHEGDHAAVIESCRSGLNIVDDIAVEAADLAARSAAMRMAADLSAIAIDVAVRGGDEHTVFAAAEGTRARTLHDELGTQTRHRPMTVDASELLQREVQSRLGRRVLVEWVVSGRRVHAVVVTASELRLVDVAELDAVERARDRALAWLDRAAIEGGARGDAARSTLAAIDATLLGPLGLPPVSDVVIVPVDGLHGVPWSGLPTLAAGSVTVAPSARLWVHADRRSSAPLGSTGLLIGRGVADADIERAAVESNHASPVIAHGEGATSGSARSMLSGLDLVHVAAHGTFRADQPLLSTLLLEDGPAPLHDVVPERLATRLVILSSCEAGAQGVEAGSEVLGLSAVLLARGASTVLAPLTVVRERECVEFVAEVHAALARGATTGAAVAEVRRRWLASDELGRWSVAASFTCFGSGEIGRARR